VLTTLIRRTVKFPDSTVAAAPITTFAPDHQAAESYRELARELISLGKIA
jgi:chromosome partitioning protein